MRLIRRFGLPLVAISMAVSGLGYSVVYAVPGPYNCCGANGNCNVTNKRSACPSGGDGDCLYTYSGIPFNHCCPDGCTQGG